MDHLGIDRFMLLGFCIGGPIIWNLLKRADDRVFSAVPVHPSRYKTSLPDFYHQNDIKRWAPRLCKERPDITVDLASDYSTTCTPSGQTSCSQSIATWSAAAKPHMPRLNWLRLFSAQMSSI